MLDIGGGELLVIGIVAPGRDRSEGAARIAPDGWQRHGQGAPHGGRVPRAVDEAMREAELEEAKKAFNSVDEAARSRTRWLQSARYDPQ